MKAWPCFFVFSSFSELFRFHFLIFYFYEFCVFCLYSSFLSLPFHLHINFMYYGAGFDYKQLVIDIIKKIIFVFIKNKFL